MQDRTSQRPVWRTRKGSRAKNILGQRSVGVRGHRLSHRNVWEFPKGERPRRRWVNTASSFQSAGKKSHLSAEHAKAMAQSDHSILYISPCTKAEGDEAKASSARFSIKVEMRYLLATRPFHHSGQHRTQGHILQGRGGLFHSLPQERWNSSSLLSLYISSVVFSKRRSLLNLQISQQNWLLKGLWEFHYSELGNGHRNAESWARPEDLKRAEDS